VSSWSNLNFQRYAVFEASERAVPHLKDGHCTRPVGMKYPEEFRFWFECEMIFLSIRQSLRTAGTSRTAELTVTQ
jgi:hypothetical protein